MLISGTRFNNEFYEREREMANVNHPNHYNKSGRKECIVEMEELFGLENTRTFCLMNEYKYRYRAGDKVGNSEEQDLKKANWYMEYAEKIKERLQNGEN